MHVHTCYFCITGTFFFSFKKKIPQADILSISGVDFKSQASSSLSGWRRIERNVCTKNESGKSVLKSICPGLERSAEPHFYKDAL